MNNIKRPLVFLVPLALGIAIFVGLGFESRIPTAFLEIVHERTKTADTSLHMLFVGDVMLDRIVAKRAKLRGDESLVKGVRSLFLGNDAVIANLEGTITSTSSVAQINHSDLRFTFDPHFGPFLKDLGVTAVSLSNNHTDDFGSYGYKETKKNLDKVSIAYFGSPSNSDELSAQTLIRGKRLCFVGYEEFIRPGLAPIENEIERIRPNCDFLVATMHGGIEYEPTSTTTQQVAAHGFINAGADLVIGTHPHVVQELEVYKNKAIFYSLGNFIFDQDFSFATTHGLAVKVSWGATSTAFTLIPVSIIHSEVKVASTTDATKILSALVDPNLPPDIASDILTKQTFSLSYGARD